MKKDNKNSGFNKHEQEILKKINKNVASGIDLEEIFEILFKELKEIVPLDRFDAGFTEDKNQRIVLFYVKTNYDPPVLVKDYVMDVQGSIFQKSINTGKPCLINNLKKNIDDYTDVTAGYLINDGIKSCLIYPIIAEDTRIGILSLGSKKPDSYTEHNLYFFQAILEGIQVIVEKTYRLLQIEKTTQTYMNMLSVVSHEMKSPLSSIITLGNTLTSGYFGKA